MASPSSQDSLYLYCLEDILTPEVEDEEEEQPETCSAFCWSNENHEINESGIPIVCFPEQDSLLFSWEDDELSALFSKEEENPLYRELESSPFLARARQEAVDWILSVNSHYSFANLTAVLALNYLDRFLVTFHLQADKPWMTQLAAVACLSVAAKVEETRVPLLIDLQVGESRYLFEPKTIQRMEIMVLSALKWRMNPVTPLSFLDYMARRLGLKDYLCFQFVSRCERLIVSLISDSRSLCYAPSVVATAAMLHVINGVEEPSVGAEYQRQLLDILGIQEEQINGCGHLIMELVSSGSQWKKRRKLDSIPGSPNGVMDLSFSSDQSDDSASSSVSSSPEPPHRAKKSRVAEQGTSAKFLGIVIPP
ncbi:unnamed protein product [Linum tenue]|uniref:B-like cyclin n=1 Tax=Linum tenue TaxID=586396 RepID=A0AAV0MSJ8_9ROSI|nr:unnamed protein product [Linum tenue]CAI0449466.1 unnamed protein product [Linum tenue]